MVCDVVEIAAGVGLVWARREGVGVPVAAVALGVAVLLGVATAFVVLAAVVSSALSVLAALVPVDVAVLSSTVSAVAFVLVPLSALPVSLLVASTCACCSAVAGGCIASAMAGIGNVVLTMEVHVIAQIR